MKSRSVIFNRRFQQAPRFDVLTDRWASIRPRASSDRTAADALRYGCSATRKPWLAKILSIFAALQRARVRRIAHPLDAIIQLGCRRVFQHANINHAHAPAALHDSRHFADHARRVGHVMQAVARDRHVERTVRERQRLRVSDREI